MEGVDISRAIWAVKCAVAVRHLYLSEFGLPEWQENKQAKQITAS